MRRRLAGGLLVLPALLVLAMAGCGGTTTDEGVATAAGAGGGQPNVSASPVALSDEDRQLKFTQCMRENGVDLPDPEPGQPGRVRINGGGDPERTKAAMEKCREFLPNGGQGRKLDPAQQENMRKLAQCMRENGVPDFPDPTADGAIKIEKGMLGELDRNSPVFQAATEKCQQFAPKLAGDGR